MLYWAQYGHCPINKLQLYNINNNIWRVFFVLFMCSNVRLTDDGPVSSFQGRSSSASAFRVSLQAIDGMTASLPASVTVYPNSHSTPGHVDPSYAWGFIIEVVSARSIVYFTNGLIILRDLSIISEMVSFVHGVASIICTYKDASIVGKWCAVIRNEPLYRPWASLASEARFQICMSPKPLGHRNTRQFIGSTTYMYFLQWG